MFLRTSNTRVIKVIQITEKLQKKIINTRTLYRCLSYSQNVRILGIETSCDDTGVAIVNGKGDIIGESLYSQNRLHVRFGGVNPLFAHDLHHQNIEHAIKDALNQAQCNINDVDAIAVTTKPGLRLSLEVGVKFAKYLAKKHLKPLIPIHHMKAHALAVRMYNDVDFPFLVLLISGGHCQLCVAKSAEEFLLLGQTLDNAPGEVLDKVARRMKLKNIPEFSQIAGGRAVELAATYCQNPSLFNFPLPLWKYRDCNFSFSGLKDSLVRQLLKKEEDHGIMGDGIIPEVNDLCAAFQVAVAEHIVQRTERAIIYCMKKNLLNSSTKSIVVSGGVACNNFIFKSIEHLASMTGFKAYRPPPKVCTDNGIMIAWNGIEILKLMNEGAVTLLPVNIDAKAPLGTSIIDDVKAANIPVKVTRLKELLG